MAKKAMSAKPSPAVLRYRGQNLEAMTATQLRNLDALRRIINLVFDNSQAITERQAQFFKHSMNQVNETLNHHIGGVDDPKFIFELQTKAYGDLCDALNAHMAELGEITSKCCAGIMQEAVESMNDEPDDDNQKSCCTKASQRSQVASNSSGNSPKSCCTKADSIDHLSLSSNK